MTALTLENHFRRNLSQYRLFRDSTAKVVVAVSTGVDSMVLLHLLVKILGPARVVVAHVNHELRSQSQDEEAYLREVCHRQQLQLVVKHWHVQDHPTSGIETAARQFRYTFFAEVMAQTGAPWLVTAHHQNDQAETILMKLTRGGQLSQLTGMAWQRPFAAGQLIRPLLDMSKEELRHYAQTQHIRWFEDVTNQSLEIQRNQFRHQILPMMQEINPQVLTHISAYREQLADVLAVSQAWVTEQLRQLTDEQGTITVPTGPASQRRLILQGWLEQTHGLISVRQDQIHQLDELTQNSHKPQATYPLENGIQVVKRYQRLKLQRQKSDNSTDGNVHVKATVLELNHWYTHAQALTFGVFDDIPESENGQSQASELWLAPEQWPLKVRSWRSTDQVRLKNGHHQRVRRLLIDRKVPQEVRQQYPVVVDDTDQVIWVPGQKMGWLARPANYQSSWRRLTVLIKETNQEENFDE